MIHVTFLETNGADDHGTIIAVQGQRLVLMLRTEVPLISDDVFAAALCPSVQFDDGVRLGRVDALVVLRV